MSRCRAGDPLPGSTKRPAGGVQLGAFFLLRSRFTMAVPVVFFRGSFVLCSAAGLRFFGVLPEFGVIILYRLPVVRPWSFGFRSRWCGGFASFARWQATEVRCSDCRFVRLRQLGENGSQTPALLEGLAITVRDVLLPDHGTMGAYLLCNLSRIGARRVS